MRSADRTPSSRLVLRGEHGGVHSLAHVNDGLGDALARRGFELVRRAPRSGQLPLAAPTVTHCWPPDFAPGSEGPTIAILPWEVGAGGPGAADAAHELLTRRALRTFAADLPALAALAARLRRAAARTRPPAQRPLAA